MNWLRKKGLHLRNKKERDGLRWKHRKSEGEGGGSLMVKGLSRRVIVVKAPDERVFEQAIFIIREDYALSAGVSEGDLLRQAREAAEDYLQSCGGGRRGSLWKRLRPPVYAAAGAAATAAAWYVFQLNVL